MKDLCTKKIVGSAMRPTIDAQPAVDALQMAIAGQQPDAALIVHFNRDSQRLNQSVHQRGSRPLHDRFDRRVCLLGTVIGKPDDESLVGDKAC